MKKTTIIALLAAFISLTANAQDTQMVVKTESGLVKGFYQEGTKAFLGIPYAKVERFMPPMPVDKWDSIMVCDHWGPQAMQNTGGRKLSEAEMSEEHSCVLNVWTTSALPSPYSNQKPQTSSLKPVMLWLHGGGFHSGTSAWDPGMMLAKKDVVVVSVNHRLNILGFLDLSACHPHYKHSGNVGMLDIVQALEWIQTNISQFGGDPNNVTIFGESGGGGKVGTLLCMPQAKGLFHKAIIMSGTILNVNTQSMTQQLGKAVLKELNIDASHISDLKKVPYDTLCAAGERALAKSIGTRKPGTPHMWGFGPTADGEVLTQQPFQDGFADFSSDIPILIGTTYNELQPLRYDKPMALDEARRELFKTFGFDTQKYISAFDEAYPNHEPQDLLSIDWMFRPKTIITADAVSKTHQAPLYMYLFTWHSPVNKGSVHGHELKFCFNRLHLAGNELPQPSAEDLKLADTMSSVWAQFAHTGNPNINGLPQWHPYTAENGELMEFNHQINLRHNHDRQLEAIINKHCFQQLDDFRDQQSRRQLKVGNTTMTIAPMKGGKIMSFQYLGQEIISQQKAPESFGSTFWTSPQKEWNWPPVDEFDKQPYEVEERDGHLIMTSPVSPILKYRVRKDFSTDEKDQSIVVTYSIINESDETRQVAPWEITRVNNEEGVIFFDAPIEGITPANLMSFNKESGAIWYLTDEANENRKINADGKGWLGYCSNGLLLLKRFADLNATQPAPGEAEIQVYVNRGKTYIELESQGAYTTLQPHQQLSWTVRWNLIPIEGKERSAAGLMKIVRKFK